MIKNVDVALAIMSANLHVLMVLLAIGGQGRNGVRKFYRDQFLAQLPADLTPIPISQVVGTDILVEEAVYRFTHDQVMDWLIPGVPATAKPVEVGVVGIIKFENGKISGEHLYWDHASGLAQLGVIDQDKTPVKAFECPRTLLEWAGIRAGP